MAIPVVAINTLIEGTGHYTETRLIALTVNQGGEFTVAHTCPRHPNWIEVSFAKEKDTALGAEGVYPVCVEAASLSWKTGGDPAAGTGVVYLYCNSQAETIWFSLKIIWQHSEAR